MERLHLRRRRWLELAGLSTNKEHAKYRLRSACLNSRRRPTQKKRETQGRKIVKQEKFVMSLTKLKLELLLETKLQLLVASRRANSSNRGQIDQAKAEK